MDTPRSLQWITRLIEADTVSRDPNRPVIDLVVAEAERLGLPAHVLAHATDPGKANLVVTVPAHDGTTTGGIVLSGHSDVVPVDGQDWASEPFAPEVRDGRFYGRGACDMKGFIGVCLELLPEMAAATLSEPIHLTLTYDEEIGCVGGDVLMKEIAELGIAPRIAFVGEPSMMQVIRAHKSINSLRVRFHGLAAHSSLTDQGVNAIEYAAAFIRKIRERADQWSAEGPFDPAYPVAHTTASCNIVTGGIAGNTIPELCEVQLECRSIMQDAPRADIIEEFRGYARELEEQMQAENPAASVEFEVLASVPGLDTEPDADAVALAHQLGGIPTEDKVNYATEAGQFSEAGISTVVCGPGDIAQAHRADEYVELSQIVACEEFVAGLIAHLRR